MIAAVADTHAVVWYLFGDTRLSSAAREYMEAASLNGDQIAVSAITLAELIYLTEKGRLPLRVLDQLLESLQGETVLTEAPFDQAIAMAMRQVDRAQVPDFPDRIIAATGAHLGVPVISRDRRIQTSSVETIW